jgi:hypothetical protein
MAFRLAAPIRFAGRWGVDNARVGRRSRGGEFTFDTVRQVASGDVRSVSLEGVGH